MPFQASRDPGKNISHLKHSKHGKKMKPEQRLAAGLTMARKAGADIPEKVEESRTLFIDGRQAFNARGQKIATLESLQHGFEIAAMRGFSEVVDVRSKARYVEAKGKLQEGGGAGVQVFFKAHLTPAGKPDTYSMRGEIQLISYNDSISSEDERNDEIDLGTIKVKLHPEVVKELRQEMRSEQQLTTKKFSQTIRITHAESHGFVVSGGWIRKPLPDSVSTPGGSTSSAFLSVEVTYGHDMIVQEESNLWTWYPSEDVKGLYAVLDQEVVDDQDPLFEGRVDNAIEPTFEASASEFQQPLQDELWAARERRITEGASYKPVAHKGYGYRGTNAQFFNAERADKFHKAYDIVDDGPGQFYVQNKRGKVIWRPTSEDEASTFQDSDRLINHLVNSGIISLPGERPLQEARNSLDIGDGFYLHDSGLDANGNWRVTISKGANRAVGIQTNGNADAAHHKSISEIAADPRAVQELKDFYMNFIHKKNRSVRKRKTWVQRSQDDLIKDRMDFLDPLSPRNYHRDRAQENVALKEGRGHHVFTYEDAQGERHSATNFVLNLPDYDPKDDEYEQGEDAFNEDRYDQMYEDLELNVLPEISGFESAGQDTWRNRDERVLGAVGDIKIVTVDNGNGSISAGAVYDITDYDDDGSISTMEQQRDQVESELKRVLLTFFSDVAVGSGWTSKPLHEADDKKVTALQNRLSGLLDPQKLKAVVEPNTDKQAVVKPAEALEQAEEKTWADKVKSVLTTAKLKFQPQGTAYFIVDYPEDLKENRRVSQADLEDMIARFNAEGSDFRLAGSYGYLDLWTKTPDGKDVRLASGSRKDIYDALVKNRFKFREASPVDTLYIDLDNAIDFLERTFFNEDDVSFELKSAGHNKELGLPFAIMSIQIQPSGPSGPRFAPVELDVKIQKLPGGEMRYSLEALPSTRLPQWTAIIQKNEGAVNNLEDRLVMAVKKVRSVLNKLLSKTESSRHAKFREVRK